MYVPPTSSAHTWAVETYDLKKAFGSLLAVNGINLKVRRGEIFGFLGPNGAGKTTTIRMLVTLIPPTSGSARVLGFDITSQGGEIRRRIGIVQQQYSYDYHLTVEKQLNVHGFLWGVPKSERKERINKLAKIFGLESLMKRKPPELSIGERRRVQVAREFIHEVELLFLDEPTIGLDPLARRTFLDFVKECVRRQRLTVFFTTHSMEEAEYLCDRIAVINKGKIVAEGTVDEIKRLFGGRTIIEIEFNTQKSPPLNLKKIENDTYRTIEILNNGKTIRVPGDKGIKFLLKVLNVIEASGAEISRISTLEPTLDDAFIKIISGEI